MLFRRMLPAGFVALFTAVPFVTNATEPDGPKGPFAEMIYVDLGADDTIDCVASHPGYVYLAEPDDGGIDLASVGTSTQDPADPEFVLEPPGIRVFRLNGSLPELVADAPFDEDVLAEIGHAYVTTGPIGTYTNVNGDTEVVLLENTFDPDLHIDCTVFTLDDSDDVPSATTTKKKKVKRKVAKASKRKVHKKAARKKAARKKATRR